jgi:cytochrome b
MVVLLLVMLAVSCLSGWLMTTPWFYRSDPMEELHEISTHLTLALIGIHVLGVIVASVLHRENLIKAMITGRKPVADDHADGAMQPTE